MINIIGSYRKEYIKNRLDKIDPDSAHDSALHEVYVQLLHASAAHGVPISRKDLRLLEDLEKNPHYRQLLEEIATMPEDQQKDYVRNIAQVPKLRLVK